MRPPGVEGRDRKSHGGAEWTKGQIHFMKRSATVPDFGPTVLD